MGEQEGETQKFKVDKRAVSILIPKGQKRRGNSLKVKKKGSVSKLLGIV